MGKRFNVNAASENLVVKMAALVEIDFPLDDALRIVENAMADAANDLGIDERALRRQFRHDLKEWRREEEGATR